MANYKEILKNIDLPLTKYEKIYTCITAFILLAIVVFIAIIWKDVPQTIPTHFNALGQVDGEGSKWTIISLPIIGMAIISFTNLFKKHPEWGNYPTRINENNAADFYLENRKLLTAINNGILLLFTLIVLEMLLVALEWVESTSIWFFVLFIIIFIFIPMIYTVLRIRKIQ